MIVTVLTEEKLLNNKDDSMIVEDSLSYSIIGAGKVGQALAGAFARNGVTEWGTFACAF